ncbi:unnamed protein product [Gadus morhua 'NCC']
MCSTLPPRGEGHPNCRAHRLDFGRLIRGTGALHFLPRNPYGFDFPFFLWKRCQGFSGHWPGLVVPTGGQWRAALVNREIQGHHRSCWRCGMIGVRAYTGTSPVPRVGCHSVGGGEEEREGADELTVTNDHQLRPRKLKNGEVTSVHAKNGEGRGLHGTTACREKVSCYVSMFYPVEQASRAVMQHSSAGPAPKLQPPNWIANDIRWDSNYKGGLPSHPADQKECVGRGFAEKHSKALQQKSNRV